MIVPKFGRCLYRNSECSWNRFYEDGTDWLVRETWHSAINGNTFDLVRYGYTNGKPSRIEVVVSAPSDLTVAWGYGSFYPAYNWQDVEEPQTGAGDFGCRDGGVSAAVGIQNDMARQSFDDRGSILPVIQKVFALSSCQRRIIAE